MVGSRLSSATEGDAALGQIVWGDLACDMIANQNLDEILANLARHVCEDHLCHVGRCVSEGAGNGGKLRLLESCCDCDLLRVVQLYAEIGAF